MGRPSSITPEIASAIEAARQSGSTVAAHHRRLAEAGTRIARGTLDKYLQRAAGERTAEATSAATAALGGGTLAELLVAAREIAKARADWVTWLGSDPRAVRAYAALARLSTDLARAIAELAPPPLPNPDHDPACAAAKKRLLAMADEVLAR
jgi:hypothetical protein